MTYSAFTSMTVAGAFSSAVRAADRAEHVASRNSGMSQDRRSIANGMFARAKAMLLRQPADDRFGQAV